MMKINTCSVHCFGVMEFRGINENGLIEKASRLHEENYNEGPEPVIMIYICSKCSRIEQRANKKLHEILKEREAPKLLKNLS